MDFKLLPLRTLIILRPYAGQIQEIIRRGTDKYPRRQKQKYQIFFLPQFSLS